MAEKISTTNINNESRGLKSQIRTFRNLTHGLKTLKTRTKQNKAKNEIILLKRARIFPVENESAVSRRWRKNTAGRKHKRRGGTAAADQTAP